MLIVIAEALISGSYSQHCRTGIVILTSMNSWALKGPIKMMPEGLNAEHRALSSEVLILSGVRYDVVKRP